MPTQMFVDPTTFQIVSATSTATGTATSTGTTTGPTPEVYLARTYDQTAEWRRTVHNGHRTKRGRWLGTNNRWERR